MIIAAGRTGANGTGPPFAPGQKLTARRTGTNHWWATVARFGVRPTRVARMRTLDRSPATDTATATALPGSTRRRAWQAPAVTSHSLLALTLTKLYLAPPAAAARPDAVTAILNGADLDAAFGPLATVVDLAAVRRVRLDLLTHTLTVEHMRPTPKGSGALPFPPVPVAVTFADYETADEVFTKLWRRLGERFRLVQHKQDGWSLARAPVAAMAGVLAAAGVLCVAANALADGGAPVPDWRWAAAAGGAGLAGLQVWLYRRLTRPPVRRRPRCAATT